MNNAKPRGWELLTLTVREAAATRFPIGAAADMLAKARADFPDYRLKVSAEGETAIILTDGMRVQRWLRA